MNRLALWLLGPAVLLVPVVVVWLVCRVCDAVEPPASPAPELRSADAEFAAIVAMSLADLEAKGLEHE